MKMLANFGYQSHNLKTQKQRYRKDIVNSDQLHYENCCLNALEYARFERTITASWHGTQYCTANTAFTTFTQKL